MHKANIRANPLSYLERASERIYQVKKVLFEAAQAAKPSQDQASSDELIEVNKTEYQRLLTSLAIVEAGLSALGSSDPD